MQLAAMATTMGLAQAAGMNAMHRHNYLGTAWVPTRPSPKPVAIAFA